MIAHPAPSYHVASSKPEGLRKAINVSSLTGGTGQALRTEPFSPDVFERVDEKRSDYCAPID